MPKYRVSMYYDEIIEAEDEGDALIKADISCDFMCDARAELIEDYEDEEN